MSQEEKGPKPLAASIWLARNMASEFGREVKEIALNGLGLCSNIT